MRAAFTVEEVADIYNVSDSHIRRLIRDGQLDRVPHMGKSVRVSWVELERVFGPLPAEHGDAA